MNRVRCFKRKLFLRESFVVLGLLLACLVFINGNAKVRSFNNIVYETLHSAGEPASLFMFGTGFIGIAGVGRKKFKND